MKVGDLAPDFELSDQSGTSRKLSALLESGPVVLFFYPAAMTPGCTAESCHFRDLTAEFAAAGGQLIGISQDTVDKQQKFDSKYSLGYPLLSDVGGKVAASFGVRRAFMPMLPTKRVTFVIGTDRRILEVVRSEIRMDVHADKALAVLRSASR